MEKEDAITYIGETDYRNKRTRFGIKAKDRSRHVYVIGKTGMGKSTLLENMAIQDIQSGNGMAFIDPHGSTCDNLLNYIPEERMKDVLTFEPFDMEHPVSFNVMEDVGADKRHLVANGLMSAFKKIWVDAWSARMEYILNNIMLALLEYPDSTLLGINRMLADKEYRKKVVDNITDTSVKAFWTDEFAKYGDRYMQEAGAAIQNKIGQFISNPLIRNIIGQPKSTFHIREMMDKKKIIIINLSKGRVGEANANLIGSMLITKIYLAAMSRADQSGEQMKKLPNFYLYVDEFQSFANESFADILSEARKYKLNLTIAHQYIAQMTDEVRDAVIGNVGTMITFRIGSYDAEIFEKEFAPHFVSEDFVNLGFAQIYLKLMINGVTSPPFSAQTLPPIAEPKVSYKDMIIALSRKRYARSRKTVEAEIRQWHENGNQRKEKERVYDKESEERGKPDRERQRTPARERPRVPLRTEKSEADLRMAISATYLKDQADKKKKINEIKKASEKGPTKERLSELKNALSSLMKKPEPQPEKEQKPEEKVPPKDKKSVKEVPEEVLKEILDIEN
jgi:energy-coupling factor transporter ATP-binding protein EcfA2